MITIDDFVQALEGIDLSDPPSTAAQWQLLNYLAKGLDIIFADSRTPSLPEIEGLDEALRYLEISMGGAPNAPPIGGGVEAARDELVGALTAGPEVDVKNEGEEKLPQHFAERIENLKRKLPTS